MKNILKNKYTILYLVGFVIFYLIWAINNYDVQPDSEMYIQMGRGIFEQFTFGYRGKGGEFVPMAFRMPLAPFIMGIIYSITRNNQLTYFFYTLFQVFLIPALPCLAYYFGSRINKIIGFGAYGLMLVHGNLAACTIMVLTDIIFAVFSGFTFVFLWKALKRNRGKLFFITGLLSGVSCMTRPIMKLYYLTTALLSFAFYSRFKPILKNFGLYLTGFFLIVSPWLIRNYIHYGHPVMETNQGLNLIWTNGYLVEIKDNDSPETRELKRLILDNLKSPVMVLLYKGWQYWLEHDYEISKKLQKIALETYLEHPIEILKNWRKNYIGMSVSQVHYGFMYNKMITRPLYWKLKKSSPLKPDDFKRKYFHLYCELNRLMRWLYMIAAPFGLLILLWKQTKLGIFFGVHIFYFTGLTAFVAGYDRYRLNIEIFNTVLIVYALYSIIYFIVYLLKKVIRKSESHP